MSVTNFRRNRPGDTPGRFRNFAHRPVRAAAVAVPALVLAAAEEKLTEAQMKEVKELRAKGEEQHKAGKHQESVESLGKAKKILSIKEG